jgi:hypothetical protein
MDCMHWEWKNCPFLHGRDNIDGMVRDALWFLRLLHHMIYAFATLSLAWRLPTMTSTCSSALRHSLGLWKAIL